MPSDSLSPPSSHRIVVVDSVCRAAVRGEPLPAVDAAVADAVLDHGKAVWFDLATDVLERGLPDGAALVDALTPADGTGDWPVDPDGSGYVASLPTDRPTVERLLGVDTGRSHSGVGGDGRAARRYGIRRFTVVDAVGDWLYAAVPREPSVRLLNGDDDGALRAVRRTLSRVPGAAACRRSEDGSLAPVGEWPTTSGRCLLGPTALRLESGRRRERLPLATLDYVGVRHAARGGTLVCRQRSLAGHANPVVSRVGRLLDRLSSTPPTRIRFERDAHLRAAIAELDAVSDRFGYGVEIA